MHRILVIEDSISVAKYMVEMLRAENYSADMAYSGEKAFHLLQKNEYELVLLDLMLPDISGKEILEAIRSKYNFDLLPVIVISAVQEEKEIIEMLEHGANDFLTKPFSELILKTKVKNLLYLQAKSKELNLQNKTLHRVFENIPNLSLIVDEKVRVLEVNRSFKQRFGEQNAKLQYFGEIVNCVNAVEHQCNCLLSENCRDCIIHNTVNETLRKNESIIKKEGIYKIYTQHKIEELVLQVSSTIIDEDGSKKVLLSIDDITIERELLKKIKEARDQYQASSEEFKQLSEILYDTNLRLTESEKKFKTITTSAQDAIIMVDTNDLVTMWNPAAEKIFGYAESEILEEPLHNIIVSQRFHSHFKHAFEHYKKTGEGDALGKTREMLAIKRNGEEFPVEISLSKSLLNNQWIAVGIVRDITQKKQFEQKLKDSEKELKTILQYQPIPVAISKNREINFINQQFVEIFGYTLADVPTWDIWFEKAYPDQQYRKHTLELFIKDVEECRRSNQPAPQRIYNIVSKNGEERNVEVSFVLLGDMIIGSFIDITEKLRSEKKLKELNATKDKFFSLLAQDLRNPFNGLLGFSRLLLNGYSKLADNKRLDYIESIYKISDNTYKLLDNLLTWSRSQTGVIRLVKENTDIRMLIHDVLEMFYDMASSKHIELSSIVVESVPSYVDKKMIETVLRNLITNAIKYTPTNGRILLNAFNDKNLTIISVKDNGIGMSAKTLNTLFKIGETTSAQGTSGETGTGLGLVICKDFIEKHGGEILGESEPGKGTEFLIQLPFEH